MVSVPLAVITAIALATGGSLGGIAAYDGVFVRSLSELDDSMLNEQVRVKGEVAFDSANLPLFFAPLLNAYYSTNADSEMVEGTNYFREGSGWCVITDESHGGHSYALIYYGGDDDVPGCGETFIVSGEMVGFYEMNFGQNDFRLIFIDSDAYHEPVLFK